MKKIIPPSIYLEFLKKKKIEPNFYCSESYLLASGAQCYFENDWAYVDADGWLLFPPIYVCDNRQEKSNKPIWSDFCKIYPSYSTISFLDWEYVYNPSHFLELKGGQWEVFRKNIRKFSKNHANWVYCDWIDIKQCSVLLSNWFEHKNDAEDAEIITNILLNDFPGLCKRALYDENEHLKAVNVWDTNWKYINYRLCIVDKKEPFVDEFSRWLFYTSNDIINSGKLVNDGGSVGNSGLERFKDKLNPIRKRKVYSYL